MCLVISFHWTQVAHSTSEEYWPFTVHSGQKTKDKWILTVLSIYEHLFTFLFHVHWFSVSTPKLNPGNGTVHSRRVRLYVRKQTTDISSAYDVGCTPTHQPTLVENVGERQQTARKAEIANNARRSCGTVTGGLYKAESTILMIRFVWNVSNHWHPAGHRLTKSIIKKIFIQKDRQEM
jgi:hypothetical protein